MCGRTACTLAPDQISTACAYKGKNGIRRRPGWTKLSGKQKSYHPSPNIGPKTFTPVMISSQQLDKEVAVDENDDRVLCEMQWGLIPSWHKGSEDSFKFNMINCRADTLLEKASFKGPLQRGQRCVVLVEGFYEWQTTKSGKKQPFFLQFKSAEGESCEDGGIEKQEHSLVKMAALYDKWYSPDSEDSLYTYSIITVNASENLKWLHHRMPAVLETEDDVCQWLDKGNVPASKAFQLLKPVTSLSWFPVSTLVNSIKNKSPECMEKIDLDSKGKDAQANASSKLMNAWVKRSPRKHEVKTDVKTDVKTEEKRQKLE